MSADEVQRAVCVRCGLEIWLTDRGVWCATEDASSAVCLRTGRDIQPHIPLAAKEPIE
jgi:hypothetical protein